MPTYLYECLNCENRHEEVRLISRRDDPGNCPECKQEYICVRRFIAPTNILVNGLPRFGSATAASIRDAKLKENHEHLEAGKKMTNLEKASILADHKDGDTKFEQRHRKEMDQVSNDIVKFAEDNRGEIKATERNRQVFTTKSLAVT